MVSASSSEYAAPHEGTHGSSVEATTNESTTSWSASPRGCSNAKNGVAVTSTYAANHGSLVFDLLSSNQRQPWNPAKTRAAITATSTVRRTGET